MNLTLENFRCFAGKHKIPIKPLTILLGENSTGKTSILAALSAIFDVGFPSRPNFNKSPYDLGGFETIASAKGRGGRPVKHFSLGYEASLESRPDLVQLATYKNSRGKLKLAEFRLKGVNAEAHLRRNNANVYLATLTLRYNGKTDTTRGHLPADFVDSPYSLMYSELLRLKGQTDDREWHTQFIEAFSVLLPGGAKSIGPIRMSPRRIYDRVGEGFDPEGAYVPSDLVKISTDRSLSKEKRKLLSALSRFGNESGLFKAISVRQFGRKPAGPFQILVNIGNGMASNLIDVGYGVSQSLPIIVQSVLLGETALLLLQQPEVHLHPKAQAALGSFFVDLVAKGKKNLVVETHSDFIVDRIRQECASGAIPPEAVVILYLERKGVGTKVFPLTLDKLGNIEGAPRSYREFFLRETMNLLSRGD